MKILVVDDNEANRKLLGWLLEDDGHDVVEAIHGQDAIDKFPAVQPDLILMDVMMPVVDGFQATSTIKQLLGPRHVPIIFLTALTDEASLAKCLSIGGDDFQAQAQFTCIAIAQHLGATRIGGQVATHGATAL